MKSILFNTEKVRDILDGRKTVTRRVVKPQPKGHAALLRTEFGEDAVYAFEDGTVTAPPYRHGDILYVRETWKQATCDYAGGGYGLTDVYLYKADEPIDTSEMMVEEKWHPSIHMPREAARIFLRVTDVRAQRLQNITDIEAIKEGFEGERCNHKFSDYIGGMFACTDCMNTGWIKSPVIEFAQSWDSALNPEDYVLYGWGVTLMYGI